MAATSLRFVARDLRPRSRGVIAVRRKWMSSTIVSVVTTSERCPSQGMTAQSSPMPSIGPEGMSEKRLRMRSIRPNSPNCESCMPVW